MFCTSPSGWSANEIALNWLTDIFIPRTQPEDPSQWRHLIIDGHRSHTQPEFLIRCLTAKIWVDFLLAYISQVLQPLDVGLFSVLKRSFRSYLRRTCYELMTDSASKSEFIEAWKRARRDALTQLKILTGWSATGIFPRDIAKPLNSRLVRNADLQARDGTNTRLAHQKTPDFLGAATDVVLKTPTKADELLEISRSLRGAGGGWDDAAKHLFVRKARRGFDFLAAELAE